MAKEEDTHVSEGDDVSSTHNNCTCILDLPSTNIPDDRRSVNTVVVSPLGNLAALVDCFGRVLLLDSQELVIRRMWKGESP